MNNHGPLTIDLDSTICETYGPAKEGARRHTYTGQRGYHPLFAVAAGTGDVLMARLRQGRANTARGAAHFLRETIGRVRYAGATGPLTMRADRGCYTHDIVTHDIVAVCRKMKVRFSITVRQHTQSLRNLIEAIPEDRTGRPSRTGWRAPPTWPKPRMSHSRVSPTPCRCGSSSEGCSPRPTPSWPSWSTTAITASSPIETATPWNSRRTTAAMPRSRTPSATSSTAWVSTICPRDAFRQRRLAGRPDDGLQPGPLDHAHRTG